MLRLATMMQYNKHTWDDASFHNAPEEVKGGDYTSASGRFKKTRMNRTNTREESDDGDGEPGDTLSSKGLLLLAARW